MSCTHLDIEHTIEKCSEIISSIEKVYQKGNHLECKECKDTLLLEVCLECMAVLCRCNNHIEEHWKSVWHKNYLSYSHGVVSCEECSKYLSILEVHQMVSKPSLEVNKSFQKLNMNWVKGFLNLKRTCYMSSLLQAILSIQPFINRLLNNEHSTTKCTRIDCILCALNKILYQMYNNTDGYVDISNLIRIFWKHSPTFAKSEYQDIQECLLYLSQQIDQIFPKTQVCTCPMHLVFGGVFLSEISCGTCQYKEESDEIFVSISMDLQDNTIEQALDRHFQKESIQINKKCNCISPEYFKQVHLKTLPQVLCLHLKRYQLKNRTVTKIEKVLEYKEKLNLNNVSYILSSIIVHSGEIDSGHYMAYTRRNNQWYLTNDEELGRVSKVDILNKPAYILFYCQENT
ncbi:ubiquitin carboxyl-terminal hydrolase 22/27/51 [Nematocida sp. AWRm80]|nr:ubiquitin carboxyl-terminal hydrolase 22/27/51 [Nematocida sp. AWRm80]